MSQLGEVDSPGINFDNSYEQVTTDGRTDVQLKVLGV
jgi:hypothetical protein